MKYNVLKERFTNELNHLYDSQEAVSLFFITLEHFTGISRMRYFEHQQQMAEPDVASAVFGVVSELQRGRPIQYIFEETWFYGLKLKVAPSVLIPRDETEELVDLIITNQKKQPTGQKKLLDIGTGSGCIAIALKKNLPDLTVSALDFSEAALQIAKVNAEANEVLIDFIHADIFSYKSSVKYDLLVSNPPYVKEDERPSMHQNVLQFEPHSALFVSNEDPLLFYRCIADFALHSLNIGGALYFEINEYLGAEMQALMKSKGFQAVSIHKDLQQKDRMLRCVL